MKFAIDIGVNEKDRTYAYALLGGMLAMGVTGFLVAILAQYLAAAVAATAGTKLRDRCLAHLNTLAPQDLDGMGQAGVINRINADVNQVQITLNRFIRIFLRAPLIVLIATIISLIINPMLGGIVVACVIPIALCAWLIARNSSRAYDQIQMQSDAVSLITKESLEGARTIRAYSRQKRRQGEFKTIADRLGRQQTVAARVTAILNPLTFAIANAATAAILFVAYDKVDLTATSVQFGTLTIGVLTALVNYVLQIANAVISASVLTGLIAKGCASSLRVDEFLVIKPSITDQKAKAITPVMNAATTAITFNNVCLAYKQNSDVLSDISFAVSKNQMVGIVGGTGAAKSSLLALIGRLYEPSKGQISVFGQRIEEWPLQQLRAQIGYAPQKAVLFAGTVRSNLLFALPSATDAQMQAALQQAQAWEFVARKKGLDTVIEQNGGNLSGGQRQRLNVARALVRNAPILILDDPFSALDYATERALATTLTKLENTTVFLSSQRLSSVACADFIVVLDQGRIVGIGTHEELLKTCAIYRTMHDVQTGKQTDLGAIDHARG